MHASNGSSLAARAWSSRPRSPAAVRLRRAHFEQRLAAHARDELPDPFGGGVLRGILLGEALIHVVVPVEHDVSVRGIQGGPEGPHAGTVANKPRAEARVVPVGQDALAGVSGEVALQPADL